MKVAICAIAKLENHYLREWVEHYLKIGANNIILYDNNDVDGECFNEVIGDYIKSGFVIVENVRGEKNIQIKSYDNCYRKYNDNYDWIAFFDIDEFLNLDTYSNFKDFLSDPIFNNFNCIKINWKNFDDNNLINVKDNNFSIKRFTHPAFTINLASKCIVKTKTMGCTIISSHGPLEAHTVTKEKCFNNIANVKSCDVRGRACKNKSIYVYTYQPNQVLLYHYRYKTLEEYIKYKSSREYPESHRSRWLSLSIDMFFTYNKLTRKKYIYAKETLNYTSRAEIYSYLHIFLKRFNFLFIQFGWKILLFLIKPFIF